MFTKRVPTLIKINSWRDPWTPRNEELIEYLDIATIIQESLRWFNALNINKSLGEE